MFFKGFQRFSKLMANEFWREILHASSKAGVPYGRIIHCNIWSLLQFVEWFFNNNRNTLILE
jgi:hypothetical protein